MRIKKIIKVIGLAILIIMVLVVALAYIIPLPEREYISAESLIDSHGNFIDINGYQGYYIDRDAQNEQVIVFIHGFGASSSSWKPVIDKLSGYFTNTSSFDPEGNVVDDRSSEDGFRYIAIDLKGFGLTEKDFRQDHSHKAQAEYVDAILDSLGVQNAIFVGHSMGGNVLAHYATLYPEKVDQMILVAPAIVYEDRSPFNITHIPPIKRIVQHIMTRSVDRAFIESTYIKAYGSNDIDKAMVDAYYTPLSIKDWELSLIALTRDSSRNSVDPKMISQNTPLTVVWGEKDTVVPIEQSDKLLSIFPEARFETYEDTGHLPHEQRVEDFANLVLELTID